MSHTTIHAITPAARPSFLGRWVRRAFWLAVLWAIAYHGLPRFLEIPPGLTEPPAPSAGITDREGRPLRKLLADGKRVETLTFAQIPQRLVDATISAEDQRFWTHGGIDVMGMARALIDAIAVGRPVSGASTITQQLVKVSYGRYHNRGWRDKLREIAYARKIEITWSKERILAEYLQRVEYGNQAIGCAAAAQLYFKKPLGDLSLAEASFLSGLPQAPSRLNPYRNFDGAKKRQEWILSRMSEDGRITAAEEKRAAREPLRLRRWTGGFEAPHFVDLLLAGKNKAPADTAVETAKEIRTTLDLELQHFAEQTVRAHIARLRSQRAREAAAVVIDNRTGGIRALVGSPDYFDLSGGQVNGALAPRSAGSTLKPFTYLLALQQGDSPATIVDDLPVEFITPTGLYEPQNYDRHCYGPMSYREALANSLNISAVRVLRRIGGPEVLQSTLQTLGFTTLSQPADHYGLGLTIGNAETRLLELANAYACLARLGEWRPAVFLANEEAASAAAGIRRFERETCWLIADMLSDPQARARCFGLESPLRLPFPAAVKTGTSTDFRDNWCVGFTPEFTAAVWVGNFDRRPMNHVSGVSGAAPIWRDLMAWLEKRRGVAWFERPDAIAEAEVDPLTGERIPAEWRGRRPAVVEKFIDTALPPLAPPERYDVLGRVVLPRDYARWLRGGENWTGSDAVAGTEALRDWDEGPLRITSPVAGATLILDPDLPGGGLRLPLRASAPLVRAEWSSDSLAIEHDGATTFARLAVGRHEIRLHDPESGETATAAITVRSL